MKRIIIEWDGEIIDHKYENCEDTKTSEVIGVLEMAKLEIFTKNYRPIGK